MMKSAEIDIVDNYLRLCEERKLDEAAKYLAAGVQLTFPGGTVFDDLPSMVADASMRYHSVRKHRTEFFVGKRASDGATMCISTGTLDGTTLWGTTFTGVRYLDLFIIEDGLIHEQYVWNDLAETGVAPLLTQRTSTAAGA
ncbi:MAG: hypothetical protein ABI275_02105 [Terrimesophilobacter sp.]